ncbi:MAG: substrate-binding domain-containing protein, partial [Thermodesulfobacteriota bacterium]
MKYIKRYIFLLFIAVLVGSMASCSKKAPVIDSSVEPVKVAVNSEFLPTANLLAEQFTANTQIAVELSSGQDPELFSQLQEGSEVDVYMASDLAHPNML